MDAAHGLSGEELEELGGALVVVPYSAHLADVAALVLMAGLLSFIGSGGLLMLRDRFGIPPWAGPAPLSDVVPFMVVMGGYSLAWGIAVWTLGLTAARALSRSPGLVAGTRGLRLHGTWPSSRIVPWAAVGELVVTHRFARARASRRASPLRLLGDPLQVPLPRGVDVLALELALRQLRQGRGPDGA